MVLVNDWFHLANWVRDFFIVFLQLIVFVALLLDFFSFQVKLTTTPCRQNFFYTWVDFCFILHLSILSVVIGSRSFFLFFFFFPSAIFFFFILFNSFWVKRISIASLAFLHQSPISCSAPVFPQMEYIIWNWIRMARRHKIERVVWDFFFSVRHFFIPFFSPRSRTSFPWFVLLIYGFSPNAAFRCCGFCIRRSLFQSTIC